MKITLSIIVTFLTFCSSAQIADNLELKKIHTEYERDHSARRIDWAMVDKRDSIRQLRVLDVLNSTESPTSNDYANAAMVYTYGHDSISEVKIVELMTKSVELDPTRDKSLLADGIDRQLIRLNKPQIYGTQSYISLNDDDTYGQIVMYEVDSTQVSDSQRIEYNVRTLAEEREYLKSIRQKPLFDLMTNGMKIPEIVKFCKKEFKENPTSKYVAEHQLSKFGSRLSRSGELEQALKIFELYAQLYPNSFNAFDFLGECYFKAERYRKGITAFERSLELNPHKDYARKKIEEGMNR
ncbi:MAG: hypothetical protein ACI837_000663 [Crocinitomicaceae bacterium]|jgi:hypothetical protein